MRTFRSLLFYLVLFLSTFILGLMAVGVVLITKKEEYGHAVGRLWGSLNLWAAGVKVEVSGIERIDPGKPYTYAANHQSLFDILAILAKLPAQFRWLAKEELFKIPILGHSMTAIGYIPINRQDRRKAFKSLNDAAERVKKGTSIVIFPEGTRSVDGVLQPFKKGGFILAIQSQQPIVPISINGSYKILPKKGEWKIRPGTIRLIIGHPIPTEGRTVKERDELIELVKNAISSNLDQEAMGAPTRVEA